MVFTSETYSNRYVCPTSNLEYRQTILTNFLRKLLSMSELVNFSTAEAVKFQQEFSFCTANPGIYPPQTPFLPFRLSKIFPQMV